MLTNQKSKLPSFPNSTFILACFPLPPRGLDPSSIVFPCFPRTGRGLFYLNTFMKLHWCHQMYCSVDQDIIIRYVYCMWTLVLVPACRASSTDKDTTAVLFIKYPLSLCLLCFSNVTFNCAGCHFPSVFPKIISSFSPSANMSRHPKDTC